jgi:L-gulono-1,4-lactone dehydrogenase
VLDQLDAMVAENDHIDVHWFPHCDGTQIKCNNRMSDDEAGDRLPRWRYLLDDELMSNGLFEAVNRLGWLLPFLVPSINRISARTVQHAILPTPHMRCSHHHDVCGSTRANTQSHASLWCRCFKNSAAGSMIMMNASASLLRYASLPPTTSGSRPHTSAKPDTSPFTTISRSITGATSQRSSQSWQSIRAAQHWGRLHTLEADQLRALYPRFDHFIEIRERLDPSRTFDNAYLRSVLGSR